MSDTQWDDLYESLAYVDTQMTIEQLPYADWIHSQIWGIFLLILKGRKRLMSKELL